MAAAKNHLGDRVRKLREEKGWSQSELAAHLPGVRQQSIDQLERGAVRGRSNAQVVENDAGNAAGHVPIIRLMQVIVQSDDGAGLFVRTVSLHHFSTEWKP